MVDETMSPSFIFLPWNVLPITLATAWSGSTVTITTFPMYSGRGLVRKMYNSWPDDEAVVGADRQLEDAGWSDRSA